MSRIWARALDILALALLALAVFGGWSLYMRFKGDSVVEEARSVVLRAQKTQQLLTGYAYVSVLRFRGAKAVPVVEDWYFSKGKGDGADAQGLPAKAVKGLCHRLYKVAFGYQDMQAALRAFAEAGGSEGQVPAMLAVEALEANAKGSFSNVDCDRYDIVAETDTNDQRRQAIMRRMAVDGLVRTQYAQACHIVAALSGPAGPRTAASSVDPSSAMEKRIAVCIDTADRHADKVHAGAAEHIRSVLQGPPRASQRDTTSVDGLGALLVPMSATLPVSLDLGPYSGAIGALTVTISTVGSVSYQDGFWITGLFQHEEFYVRRDITTAMYGSTIRDAKMRVVGDKRTLLVQLEEPALLMRDRRIDFGLASKDFQESETVKGSDKGLHRAERNIVSSVDWALRDVDSAARRLARVYVRSALEAQAEQEKAVLQLQFD